MTPYDPFDNLHAPLEGTNLIEASAGTGKTYTLTALFLRFIVEKGLPVDRILVVTFTEAATNELEERTRSRLRKALEVFSGRPGDDPFLGDLASKPGSRDRARQRIDLALRDFDRAAIFTIHGFCRRVLAEHAFESGAPFDTELLSDVKQLQREAVDDFWRREVAAASVLFASYALARGFTPEALMTLCGAASGFLEPQIVPRPEMPESTETEERKYDEAFQRVSEAWSAARDDVSAVLIEHKALNRTKYRKASVERWIREMDITLGAGRTDPLLFDGFEKFTASYIRDAARSGKKPPHHPFFDLCDTLLRCREALEARFDRKLLALKARLFDELQKNLSEKKAARNAQSFDDLLRGVHAALFGPAGDRLAAALRSRYEAALIDEFQDTDPLQYGIFKRAFGNGDMPLFLIGDPKQAIYGFRGADVFAYMKAAREADRRYTLPNNHRSEPGLVKAVNTLFSDHDNPFAFRDIPFHAVGAACREEDAPLLRVQGREEPPFRFWLAEAPDPAGSNQAITREAGRFLIPEAVACEVVRLIEAGRAGKALIGENPLREEDIAVLLRTNEEARVVQRSMARRRIPSVLYTTSSLFETEEAEEMGRILTAMARPEHEGLLLAALTTMIMGADGPALEIHGSNEPIRELRLMRFRTYHEMWREEGFIQAFRELLRDHSTLLRLLRLPDGERRVTNLLHLAEVLHQAESSRGVGMEGLAKWLIEQRDPAKRGSEEQPLRLESDRNAVKLVTIHKSKGLEYPVVFCPFMWRGSDIRQKEAPVLFHERTGDGRLTLDLGSSAEDRERHVCLAEQEALSENLRILYVAFTRARNRCYTIWGRFNRADTSAPTYLFHARRAEEGRTPTQASALRFAELQAEDVQADLESLRDASGGTIHIAPLPSSSRDLPPRPLDIKPGLSARTFKGRIDRARGIASFSSLTSTRRHAAETADYDFESDFNLGTDTATRGDDSEDSPPAALSGFPSGARSGTCLHAILENVDFTNTDPSVLSAPVRAGLLEHGFDPAWEAAVSGMIKTLVSTPLDPGRNPVRLDRVFPEDRMNELAFFFPLARISPENLRDLLLPHMRGGLPESFPTRMGALGFSPVEGFVRGFIDLVFRIENRFYIADWKSNDLGPLMSDYHRDSMERAMLDGAYHLQYLLYTLALDRYLSMRLHDYAYDIHFGGVFYVFLRGLDPAGDPGAGVYRARPSESLIRDLRDALIPGRADPDG